jgi:hypothetical protein
MEILAAVPQIDNGIADQLTRAVIRRLASAINRNERMGQVLRAAQTRLVRRTADRVNRFVFQQKQFVAQRVVCSFFGNKLFL